MTENQVNFKSIKEKARELLLIKDYKTSLIFYQQCEELIKNSEPYLFESREKAIIFLNMAICFINLFKNCEAENYIDNSIQSDITYVKAHYRKAVLLKNQEKFIEALEVCQNALKIEKNQEIIMLIV